MHAAPRTQPAFREVAARLATIVALLGALLTTASRALAAPDDDPADDVAQQVLAILKPFEKAKSYTTPNPEVPRLVALGPDAVPTLLDVLARERTVFGAFAREMAVAEALGKLATAADVPRLTELALAGSGGAAEVLGAIGTPAAVKALLSVVEASGPTWKIASALEPRMDDPAVLASVLGWLAEHRDQGDWQVAAAISLLGHTQDPRAVDALIAARPHAREPQTVWRLGQALVRQERKDGVDVLVGLVERAPTEVGPEQPTYFTAAARALNRLAGERHYEQLDGSERRSDAEEARALTEAAPRLVAWWKSAREAFDFDSVRTPMPPGRFIGTRALVLGPDGPVAGATVRALNSAGSNAEGAWLPSDLDVGATGEDGRVELGTRFGTPCLMASKGSQCAFVCNHETDEDPIELRLADGVVIEGVLLGPGGKPVAQPQLRVRFASGYEWHHLDLAVDADGVFRSPALPAALVATADCGAYLEAQAEGLPVSSLALDDLTTFPVAMQLRGARTLRGLLVGADGRPVLGARFGFDADESGMLTTLAVGRGPAFEVGGVPDDVTRLFVLSDSHAEHVLEVPAGRDAADLGEVVLNAGKPIRGRVRTWDDRGIASSFLVLSSADGTRIATGELSSDGSFDFPHVGPGRKSLLVVVHQLEGVATRRWIELDATAGSGPIDAVLARGIRIRLRDADGQPFRTHTARVAVHVGGSEQFTQSLHAQGDAPFSAIDLEPLEDPSLSFVVTVEDREPVTVADVRTDAAGTAVVDVVVR